ncbi:UNVERIFIED_CONTAM: hypothetical protein K2H54_008405 [Gekko kuhli]
MKPPVVLPGSGLQDLTGAEQQVVKKTASIRLTLNCVWGHGWNVRGAALLRAGGLAAGANGDEAGRRQSEEAPGKLKPERTLEEGHRAERGPV